ncbi:phage repressor protein [Photobacterium frigidiphilum]|uniref:Phage repressor protein n=1 Tax=Photobacterium frigidiphilum TaxID=264736 RepID=A0A2T3J7W9_9GAMM|nr:helix-turn-helix transcriptional regulator [Photobacterium frigidiphilum]PSU44814.1 phage repressor protein [Photobacterium frigidiphilum]
MRNIGFRIKNKRKLRGLTQELLAKKVGVTKAAVSRWETGKNTVASDKLSLLADILEVNADWLLTGDLFASQSEADSAVFWAPLCNEVCASAGNGEINCDYTDRELIPIPQRFIRYQNNRETIFCVLVKGDSMSPVLLDGSIIAVNSIVNDIRDGRMYLIKQGDLLRVKVLQRLPNKILLQSYNVKFKDEIYEDKDTDIQILGEVFWFSSLVPI